MSNIAKLVIGSNKISPEKRHTNTTKLLSCTKNWLNLSNISNRKKIGIQTIIRSCSMGSLDKMMNETKSIHDNTIGDNHETIVYQLDKSNIFTEPLRNSPRDRSYEFSSTSTGMAKHFSENCLSDLNSQIHNSVKLPNKPSTSSLASWESLCSLSSSDSMPRISMIKGVIRSISNDALLRDTIISLKASLSSYNIQSPRNDRFEGIVMCVTKK
jgi:hypothetical protein